MRNRGDPKDGESILADAGDWLDEHTVWYSWEAPNSGSTTIDTCQANIDSILAVYTGTELNNLSRVADNNNDYWVAGEGGDLQRQCRHTYRIVVCDAGGLRKSTFTLKLYNAASSAYTINDLGTLPGASASWGSGVNDSGQVVGGANTSVGTFHASSYSGGLMKDHNDFILADSGWELTHAWAIITSGQIVGEGKTNGQDVRSRG